MPCDTGLLLNAIAALSGSTTLLPGRRTSPAAGAGAKGSLPVRLRPARPGLYPKVLGIAPIPITKGTRHDRDHQPRAAHRARLLPGWTSHDLDKAMSYIAADIVCDAPAGRLEGAGAYRGFLGPFVQILTSAKMVAAFGDDQTALVMYDTQTVPVQSAPGAECVTVKDGKITYSRFVFDRAPSTPPARPPLDPARPSQPATTAGAGSALLRASSKPPPAPAAIAEAPPSHTTWAICIPQPALLA